MKLLSISIYSRLHLSRPWIALLACAVFCSGCSFSAAILPGTHSQSRISLDEGAVALGESQGIRHEAPKPALLPSLPLVITPEVQREINLYLSPGSTFIQSALTRREAFYPMMVEIFRDEGVPPDLINVALIESGFKPEARSYAGAVGLWQFMKATARRYNLVISKREDQRKDPILSTVAAARHLRDLYMQYEDWYLALAAYNAGSGGIDRAMMRSGSADFWQLSRKKRIRAQTARYVPKIIAAALIVRRIMAPTQEEIAANMRALKQQGISGLLNQ